MIFTVTRPDGSTEHRRHVPFNIVPDGARWKAIHAGNGRCAPCRGATRRLTT
jgi:hypothetical protein